MLKKGAMFGLDARIALAIFGALSVISGAALYSAIKDAKITAMLTEVEEIEKALTAYILDVGSFPPHATTNPGRDLNTSFIKMKKTGIDNWKGPYFTDEDETSKFIVTSTIENSTLTYRNADTWTDYNTDSNCTKSGDKCAVYVWVSISDDATKKEIEKRLDNNVITTATEYSGNVRVHTTGVFIKTDLSYPNSLAATS